MLRHSSTSNPNNGKKREPNSKREPQFFKGTPPAAASGPKKTPPKAPPKTAEPIVPEIRLHTPTEFLLAAILEELKTHNAIELIKLEAQEKEKLEELQAAQKAQEADKARFEELRPSLYM